MRTLANTMLPGFVAHRVFKIARPDGEFECLCGNGVPHTGFHRCDETGQDMGNGPLWRCDACGLLVTLTHGYVVGAAADGYIVDFLTPITKADGQSEKFLRACVALIGPGFSPEWRFDSYKRNESSEQLFPDELVALLELNLEAAYNFLGNESVFRLVDVCQKEAAG